MTTLWELFATFEPKDFFQILFVLDLRRFDGPVGNGLPDLVPEPDNDDETEEIARTKHEKERKAHAPEQKPSPPPSKQKNVVLVGNFTKWNRRIKMVESATPELYYAQLKVPPGCTLLFRFQIDDR